MLQALAIKYRPKSFDELIGQDTVSASLKYALNQGRLAHAYLFSGLRGSGKTSSARIFARALVCEEGPSANPCGECSQCKSALEGRHMDIIEMDAASHRGLEDIQDLIEQTKYAPSTARYKIFIIDEVHMLTQQAANALLKTLEEPPGYVKFILATTDPLKLPATVLSRTQHFRFKQIPQSAALKHLEWILKQEGVSFEEDALKLISRSGQGSLRDTLTLLDQAIIYSQNEITSAKMAQMLGFLDPEQVKNFYQLIIKKEKERVLEFLKDLQDYEASSVIDEMIFYLKESFFAKNNEFSMLLYERFFHILSRAKTMLANCDDNAFVLCVMSFMMIEASHLKQIDEAIDEEERSLKEANKPKSTENFVHTPTIQQKQVQLSEYERLKKAIYERDFTLGECFEKNTSFLSLENNNLKISSKVTTSEDRDILNKGFGLITKLCAQELGDHIKISVQKADTKKKPLNKSLNSTLNSSTQNASPLNSNQTSLYIDESKLQDIKNPKKDLRASFEELKSGAKKQDIKEETITALGKCFGEPSRE